jgi:catechol 2,3-dioxygenase-like lactoylglutathione lyase family enzyme
MTQTQLGRVVTIVVPVADQAAALDFYVETLGMTKVNDFTYSSGERWLEVSPAPDSSNLCLVASRPERPAGIETGIVLFSDDVLADLAAFRARGLAVDEEPLTKGDVVWWSGAPLAGVPTQFRLRDPDGNSFLVVASS